MTPTNPNNKSLSNQTANVDRLEETFRREGNAEILELSHSTLDDSIGGGDSSDRIRSRQVNEGTNFSLSYPFSPYSFKHIVAQKEKKYKIYILFLISS